MIDNHDVLLVDQNEPTTYQEAMLDPDSEKWLEAMKSEIQSMYDNQVWTLIDPPEGTKTIGCKWVFKKKTDMDGKVHTYKARLVAKCDAPKPRGLLTTRQPTEYKWRSGYPTPL